MLPAPNCGMSLFGAGQALRRFDKLPSAGSGQAVQASSGQAGQALRAEFRPGYLSVKKLSKARYENSRNTTRLDLSEPSRNQKVLPGQRRRFSVSAVYQWRTE